MATPYYHTDRSALETIQNYADCQGLDFEAALEEMELCWDDLDRDEQSALDHYWRGVDKENS